MNIDSIRRGLVIDHIKAGNSMLIYHHLKLDQLDCSIAIIKNCKSTKMGRKDIIKIDDAIELDLDVLGYIDPDITVNVIDDGRIIEKRHLSLPERIVNVVSCKNPRCITTTEPGLDQVFRLCHEGERDLYRCIYCDAENK